MSDYQTLFGQEKVNYQFQLLNVIYSSAEGYNLKISYQRVAQNMFRSYEYPNSYLRLQYVADEVERLLREYKQNQELLRRVGSRYYQVVYPIQVISEPPSPQIPLLPSTRTPSPLKYNPPSEHFFVQMCSTYRYYPRALHRKGSG